MSNSSTKAKSRVFVSALFCETVLKDGDILSAIRVTNIFNVQPITITPHHPDGTPATEFTATVYPPVPLQAIFTFYSEMPERFIFRLRAVDPQGKEMEGGASRACETLGGVEGFGLNVRLSISSEHEGVSWFELYIDDVLATKLPIKIIRQKSDTQTPLSDLRSAEQKAPQP